MKNKCMPVMLILIFLSGCTVRSISETGYAQKNDHSPYGGKVETISPELEELDVLGINKNMDIDENRIKNSIQNKTPLNISRDSSIMIVQSGAEFPDSEMIESLSKYWNVSQLSGDRNKYKNTDVNKLLRYTAATGGNEYLLVYWGIVETSEKNIETKSVSWVPLVGWGLPDEKTNMRIRLKFAVINVESGTWQIFQPKPVESEFLSSIVTRRGKDQEAVIELKKLVYEKAADELYEKYGL